MRWYATTDWGAIGNENYNTGTDSTAATNTPVTQNKIEALDFTAALTGIAAADLVGLKFIRVGANVGDTVNADCYYLGLVVRYV